MAEGQKPRKLFAKHIVRKIFLEDWALKLLALVITLALWLGVTGLSTPTKTRVTVPLVPSISNSAEITNSLILTIRSQKVMLGSDLAELYGVTTKADRKSVV